MPLLAPLLAELAICSIVKERHVFQCSRYICFVQVFTKARAAAPAILFLDEVDAVVRKRSTDGSSGIEARILSTLLNEIDGVGISSNVYETSHNSRLVLTVSINHLCIKD